LPLQNPVLTNQRNSETSTHTLLVPYGVLELSNWLCASEAAKDIFNTTH